MNNFVYFVMFVPILCISCKTYKPLGDTQQQYLKPDFSQIIHWAAHPDILDESDRMPEGGNIDNRKYDADVFFLHPTTYTGSDKSHKEWNGPLNEPKLDKKTDEGTIRFQASAFNHAGRVFAPRYRQAHLHAYFTQDKEKAKKAFDLAYEDVKAAFEYYLRHHHNNRPIIIASHSQGTTHAIRLIKEYFDQKPLNSKLVAAYLLGMPVAKNEFKNIRPCQDSTDTGCSISWRTFKKDYVLKEAGTRDNILVTNPISWTLDQNYIPKSQNKGTLLYNFNKIYPELVDAQVSDNILWASKPKFRGSIFLRTKNYHPADVNFYYFSIRDNAALRVRTFLNPKKY
jgi:hypothetical protein